jgi:hypothetical protein
LDPSWKRRVADAALQTSRGEVQLHEFDHGQCLRSGEVFALSGPTIGDAFDYELSELV